MSVFNKKHRHRIKKWHKDIRKVSMQEIWAERYPWYIGSELMVSQWCFYFARITRRMNWKFKKRYRVWGGIKFHNQ